MPGIDGTVKDLSDLLSSIIGVSYTKNGQPNKTMPSSLIGISFNITTKTLDEQFPNTAAVDPAKQYPPREKDPLIDIIEDKDNITVVASLPGIKKEDIWFDIRKNMLVVEITKYGNLYRKEILCDSKVEKISVNSSTVNNSVLEVVFDKK